jgi:hypothetical protein
MTSIEWDVNEAKRFTANVPFSCIDIKFGEASDVITELDLSVPTIMWLDYDGTLDSTKLLCIKRYCADAVERSLLIVTVSAAPEQIREEKRDERLNKLAQKVGRDKIPPGTTERDLPSWGTACVLQKIIDAEIRETLEQRNAGLDDGDKVKYRQLFNFIYADNVQMLTVGGILLSQRDTALVDDRLFKDLPFIQTGSDAYRIRVPVLTLRERRYLDTLLPLRDKLPVFKHMPNSDVEWYKEIYRYFPTFAETNI